MVGVTVRVLLYLRGALQNVAPQLAYVLCGLSLALMAYLITGMFAHFSFVRFFWLIMALSHAAICVAQRELAASSGSGMTPEATGGSCHAS